MNKEIIPQVLPSVIPALKAAVEARLDPKVFEMSLEEQLLSMGAIVDRAVDRLGQKNIGAKTISIIVEDLVDAATITYPFITAKEVSIAIKEGVLGKLPTKSFHLNSQVVIGWLTEWVDGPRKDATAELMRLRPKTELRLPENTEPLWKNGYKNYCEGRYPYGTPMMYKELVEEGRIMLSSEDKKAYLRRAVEEDRREYEAQQNSTNKTIRMKAVERLTAHQDLDIENHVPDWLITVAQYLIVTEYFDKLKAREGDAGAA